MRGEAWASGQLGRAVVDKPEWAGGRGGATPGPSLVSFLRPCGSPSGVGRTLPTYCQGYRDRSSESRSRPAGERSAHRCARKKARPLVQEPLSAEGGMTLSMHVASTGQHLGTEAPAPHLTDTRSSLTAKETGAQVGMCPHRDATRKASSKIHRKCL